MEQDVDIRNHPPLLHQSKFHFRIVVEVIRKHLNRDLDLPGLLKTMKRNGLISKDTFVCLRQKIMTSRIKLREFVPHILLFLTFEQFCFVFEEEGYSDISTELRSGRYTLLYKTPMRIEMQHSKRTHDYYKTLKSCIDNDSFNCERSLQLRKFIKEQDEKLASTLDISLHDRQFAMERKAAATVLLIQQHKDNEERKKILEQAVATETNGIDNTSLQIIYHSKMALTEALTGNVRKAEDHIVQTKILCQMYGPCFAVTSAFHDIQYTYKTLYFMTPSEEMLEKILTEGDIAIHSLDEEKEDVQNLWKRIMLLFMVLSLLFITPEFGVCDISKIKKVHKTRAKRILKEIKRCSDDIELRREMILYLCLAVLNEENDISLAETYAQLSLDDAMKGGCFRDIEKQNIEKYLKKIKRKKLLRKLRTVLITLVFSLGVFQLMGLFAENENCYVFVTKVIVTILVIIFTYTNGLIKT